MIQIYQSQQIEGVVVYGDDEAFNRYYLLPQTPRFRLDERGNPVFKLIKYRTPVDRPNGAKGGGFLIFDAEFVVDEAKVPKITDQLQSQVQAEAARRGIDSKPVEIGTISYTDGTTQLNFLNESDVMVAKVFNPGKPSLFGNNITPFSVELTPEGATLAEQALQGKGGIVQVVYDLTFIAKLPPMTIDAWFNSTEFYRFYQTIDIDWNLWSEDSYRESLTETMVKSQAINVVVDPGGITDTKIVDEVKQWAMKTLQSRIESDMVAQLTPVPDDQRNAPDGIENVTRDISKTSITSFSVHWSEKQAVNWTVHPGGTLPNITNLKAGDGSALKWEDYFVEVDLDDDFFKQVRVDVNINADFEHLPIHSVEVKLDYKGTPMPVVGDGPNGEVSFDKDTVGPAHFAAFVQDDDWGYTYSYQVNYTGAAKIFQSDPIDSDEGILTIGVDDVGILLVEVGVGDINWTEVASAQVHLSYADADAGVDAIEEAFVLDKDHTAHTMQKVIFSPFRKSYKYTVKYVMADGKEYQVAEQEGRAHNLFINDPFSGSKTVKVVGAADFTKIQNIFLDLSYDDDGNDYQQKKSVALNATTTFFDWAFPVIDEHIGSVTYSGTVLLADGTVHDIASTTTDASTIIVPKAPVSQLAVQIVTDLIDWTAVKLIKVSLAYADDANFASFSTEPVFSAAKKDSVTVPIPIYDATKNSYRYSVDYYLADGTRRSVPETESSSTTIILEVPAA